MKRSLVTLFGLAVLGLISAVLLNQWDPPLKPEVERILNQKHDYSDNQKRAHFYLLGIQAWNFGKDSSTPEALTENKTAIEQYIKLMEYEEVAPLATNIALLPFTGHAFFLLQLAQWFKQGGEVRALEVLESSNHYMESVMNQGVLLERQVAINNMKANAQLLREQILINPKLKGALTPALIDSFSTPDVDSLFNGAIDSETKVIANIVRSKKFPGRFLIRPNETLNRYYEISSEALASDCLIATPGEEEKCIPSWRWTQPRMPWEYLINPLGKDLVRTFATSYVARRTRTKELIAEIYQARAEFSR